MAQENTVKCHMDEDADAVYVMASILSFVGIFLIHLAQAK